jgi:isoleucyl-tRNA synthetase
MVPFITEEIYQNIVRSVDPTAPESIHLCDYPKADESMIDAELEQDMEQVLIIKALGLAARNASNRKIRQPLAKMYIKSEIKLPETYLDIIRDEVNVKCIEYSDNVSDFIGYKFKPQLKTLGPKFGRHLNEIRTALAELDGNAAYAELEANGVMKLTISTGEIELMREDVLIETEQRGGYFTQTDSGVTIALDTNLTPELVEEGYVREFISKVQKMRKDSGFEVMDRIIIHIGGNDKLAEIVAKNEADISKKLLSDKLLNDGAEGGKEYDMGGEMLTIAVEKV